MVIGSISIFEIIISLILFFLISIILYVAVRRSIKDNKHIRTIRKETAEEKQIAMEFITNLGITVKSVDLKVANLEINNREKTQELAWFSLIQISTRFTYNEDKNERENIIPSKVLSSFYSLFKELRNKVASTIPENKNVTLVVLYYLNNILRPFLRKWDKIINSEERLIIKNETKSIVEIEGKELDEFLLDLRTLKTNTEKYKIFEELVYYCGFTIKKGKLKKTITSEE